MAARGTRSASVGFRRPLVLCYHAVSDGWPDPLAVPVRSFERQLRSLLRRGFRSVPAADAVARTGRLVHVTFDDAYRSVVDVLPLLERLDVHATVFACTGFASEGRPLLIPELEARARGYEDELSTMDWEALRAAGERGVEIGSHTVSHAHLPELSDSELRRELEESKERIADELRRPCRLLAYPFGESDDRVHAAARVAGYEAAFSLLPKGQSGLDRYAVPRVDLYRGDGWLRFRLKTSILHAPITGLAARFAAGGHAGTA